MNCDVPEIKDIMQSLQLSPQPSETSFEELLSQANHAKIAGKFSQALCSLEQALLPSEREDNQILQLKVVELIGDLYLHQKKYVSAAKIYACCLAMLGPSDASRSLPYFIKLKEAELAFMATKKELSVPLDKLSTEQLRKLQSVDLSLFPYTFQSRASEIKAKFLGAGFHGAVAKKYWGNAADKFLILATQVLPLEELEKGLHEIERIIKLAECSNPSHPGSISKYRNFLSMGRQALKRKCADGEPSASLAEYATEILTCAFKDIIWDCLQQMGHPPCPFAILGIGSMAKGEMTPYSDVEYAILIENDNPEIRDFFTTLARLIELKIIQLGETPFPLLNRGTKSPTGEGFRTDAGGNTPLCEILSLLATPAKLASYQQPFYFKEPYLTTVNALRDSCFVFGSRNLYHSYEAQVCSILQSPSQTVFPSSTRMLQPRLFGTKGICEIIIPQEAFEQDPQNPHRLVIKDQSKTTMIEHDVRLDYLLRAIYSGNTLILQEREHLTRAQDYGYILAKTAAKEFKPDLERKILYQHECVVIKRELGRLPGLFVSSLALYFGCEEKNFWQRCKELVSRGKLSPENGNFLMAIMDEIMRLRFESQLFYEEEREEFYLTERSEPSGKRLVANRDQLARIKRIYQLIYPLHSVLSLFTRNRIDRHLLKSAVVYQSHSFAEEGKRCLKAGDLGSAIDALKMELALEPGQEEIVALLRACEDLWNLQKEEAQFLQERETYYKTHHAQLNIFLQQGSNLKRVAEFGQLFALPLKLNHKQLFDLLQGPFSYLAAHLDLAIKHGMLHALHFFHFLSENLQDRLPQTLVVEWSQGCIELFRYFLFMQRQAAVGRIRENSPRDFLVLDGIVRRLTALVSVEHPSYPSAETFLILADHFFRQRHHDKTKDYLQLCEQKAAMARPEERAKLRIVLLDLASRQAAMEGNRGRALQVMKEALSLAKERAYAADLLERRLAILESSQPQQAILLDEEMLPLPSEDDQAMAEMLLPGNSLLALPYFERLLERDPANKTLKKQVDALQIVRMMHDFACSHVAELIPQLEILKDLDHQLPMVIPQFLLAPDQKPLLDLAQQAPARFNLALFYGHMMSCKHFYQVLTEGGSKQSNFSRVVVQCMQTELQKLLDYFKGRLPKNLEVEVHLNLSHMYSDWECYHEAEAILQKALTLHQTFCPADPQILNIYIELGRTCKNLKQFPQAKRYYQLASNEVKRIENVKQQDLILLYDGLAILAVLEKDWKGAVTALSAMLECQCLLQKQQQDLGENHQINQKTRELFSQLVSQSLWDESMQLLEKMHVHLPDQAEKALFSLLQHLFGKEDIELGPYFPRLIALCSLPKSSLDVKGACYLFLVGLLFTHEQDQMSLDLMQKAKDEGVPEKVFEPITKKMKEIEQQNERGQPPEDKNGGH